MLITIYTLSGTTVAVSSDRRQPGGTELSELIYSDYRATPFDHMRCVVPRALLRSGTCAESDQEHLFRPGIPQSQMAVLVRNL